MLGMKGGSCCSAKGCTMRTGTNLLSKVRMFRFPRDPDRRKKWEQAVNRENWVATEGSRLCNRHFITGSPSSYPLSPDYVPSIFSHTIRTSRSQGQGSQDCDEREVKRIKIEDSSELTPTTADETASPHFPSSNPVFLLPLDNTVTRKTNVDTMTDLSDKDISKMESILNHCKAHIGVLQKKAIQNTLTARIMEDFKAFSFYTKFPSYAYFNELLKLLLSNWKPITKSTLSYSEQLLLVSIKLRLGLMNEDLAYRFSCPKAAVSSIFREWIRRMAFVFKQFIKKPSLKNIRRHMPQCFSEANLNQVTSIIDCIEVSVQKPFLYDTTGKTYSYSKYPDTMKFLISITPFGAIEFLSKLFEGETSDEEIANLSGFLDTRDANDVVITDTRFGIRGVSSLSEETVRLDPIKIHRVRVHVKRCLERIKSFGILKTSWPSLHFTNQCDDDCIGNNILTVIAALCNIMPP